MSEKVHLRCIRCNELIADDERAKSALNPWHQACFDRAFEVSQEEAAVVREQVAKKAERQGG